MARRSIIADDEPTVIDLSPMIDCVFILLIFFIVTTVFVEEKGFQANKPDAAATVAGEDRPNVVLEITAENKVLVGGEEVSIADIPGLVKDGLEKPDTPVTIRANEHSTHGTFVAVWDAARRGGAQALSFTTVN